MDTEPSSSMHSTSPIGLPKLSSTVQIASAQLNARLVLLRSDKRLSRMSKRYWQCKACVKLAWNFLGR